MSQILKKCAFHEADIDRAKVLILGKLMHPASERETFQWFQQRSALDEVMGIQAKHVSLSSLYRTCDRLVAEKEAIEQALVQRERELFGLGEKIILYDLTNTDFEGNPCAPEAQRGASILDDLLYQRPRQLRLVKPTVVTDAGLVTEANL